MNWLSITFSMTGKFFNTASFDIVYIYSAEIFPTVVRNVGVGSSSAWARVGALVAPFIKEVVSILTEKRLMQLMWIPLHTGHECMYNLSLSFHLVTNLLFSDENDFVSNGTRNKSNTFVPGKEIKNGKMNI